jgi:hypothetical protein
MTLYEFHALQSENQLVYIWDNGQYLMKRSELKGAIRVGLYDCGEFFAEIFYDTKSNAILSHRAFNSAKLLEPYLGQIKLSDIERD